MEVFPRDRDDGLPGPEEAFCYASSPAFPPRVQRPSVGIWTDSGLSKLQIHAEIVCNRWTQYKPGRSPEKHEEMSLLDKVKIEYAESREMERRARDAADRKALEIRQAERKEDQETAERRHRETLRNGQLTRRIALASVAAAFISAVIAAGALAVNYLSNRDKIIPQPAPRHPTTTAPVPDQSKVP